MARDLIATWNVSINQACRVVSIDHKTYRYVPKKRNDDTLIETLLKKFSVQHPEYGFVKLFNLIRQKGYVFNHKRIYRDLELNLKIKPKKRWHPERRSN